MPETLRPLSAAAGRPLSRPAVDLGPAVDAAPAAEENRIRAKPEADRSPLEKSMLRYFEATSLARVLGFAAP